MTHEYFLFPLAGELAGMAARIPFPASVSLEERPAYAAAPPAAVIAAAEVVPMPVASEDLSPAPNAWAPESRTGEGLD